MEAHGLITRRPYSDHPPRLEYRLTAKGRSLGPVLEALPSKLQSIQKEGTQKLPGLSF
jgi:DNA-binding HxlR family transcriptional regulator